MNGLAVRLDRSDWIYECS